jgi:hypothetical protein
MLTKLLGKIGRKLVDISAAADKQQKIVLPLEALPNAPDLFQQYRSFNAHPDLERVPGGWKYKGKIYPDLLTVGGAGLFIFRTAKEYCKGSGIELGAGLWPFPESLPIDIWRGPGAGRSLNDIPTASQNYVFSSHCLEHVSEWQSELDIWISKLKSGGVIFLYLPHPECGIWNPGSPMVGSEHKWQPEPQVVKNALQAKGFEIIACDDGPDAMMSFFVCGKKLG